MFTETRRRDAFPCECERVVPRPEPLFRNNLDDGLASDVFIDVSRLKTYPRLFYLPR